MPDAKNELSEAWRMKKRNRLLARRTFLQRVIAITGCVTVGQLLKSCILATTVQPVTGGSASPGDQNGVPGASEPASVSPTPVLDPWDRVLKEAEDNTKAPFRGITEAGKVEEGLYSIRSTGVSTKPVQLAAQRFLDSLDAVQKKLTQFDIQSDRWRKWSNTHRYPRVGVSFGQLSDRQRKLAFGLLKASLSARGLKQSETIIKLNGHLGELTGKPEEFSSGLYWLSIFSDPSSTQPWGWQLDGHHLNINYFVLRDQVVTTPLFMGSEPVNARYGPLRGIKLFEKEENLAYELMSSLSADQKKKAVLADEIPSNVFTAGFRDNYELRYEGIAYLQMTYRQQEKLLELVGTYTGRQRKGHAELWLKDVKRHKERLFFAWMGGIGPKDVFYYRIHSPVILIEFDHQAGLFLDKGKIGRDHIHSVVRTPNGNDYGKDLLRQHYSEHDHRDGKPHSH
jgi:hypothetical protein